MATKRVSILNWATRPTGTGVFFTDYADLAANDTWHSTVLCFLDFGTRAGVSGSFEVPQDYVDTANFVIVWTAAQILGDVEFDIDYRAVGGNDAESLDQATVQEPLNAADTAPSAVNERMELSIAATDGNFAAGDTVLFNFYRDGTDAGDTMSGHAIVFDVFFEYSDTV